MKITLVQAEIHNAIEAYIRNQITVNEGMKIEINLRATRGEEGATAEIDIVADIPEAPVEPVKATRAPRAAKVPVEQAMASKPAPTPSPAPELEPAKVVQEEQAEVLVDELPEDPEPNSEQALAAEAARTEPAEEEVPAEPVADAPRKSLFAGLGKPSNQS